MKARIAALALAGGLVLTCCGAAPILTAAEKVPTLRTSLNSIDTALADHHYAMASHALARLVTVTRAAERSGSLSAAAANRIIAAARNLLAQLPNVSDAVPEPTPQVATRMPSQSPSPSQSRTPSATPAATKPKNTTAPPAPTLTPTPTPSPTPSPSPDPSPSATISSAASPFDGT